MAREADLDLAGTAPCSAGFLLVEWPRPWPARTEDVPELAPVHAALTRSAALGRSIRLQLIGTCGEARPSSRVALYVRTSPGGSIGLAADELVDHSAVVPTALSLLDRPRLAHLGRTREMLLCSNGSRDVCCGSLGTSLADRLSASFPADVWRTSHTGGHRFAPTGFTLPDGAFWGRLDDAAAEVILRRDRPVDLVLRHFRGTALHCDPAVQVVERAVLRRVGWALLDAERSAVTATGDDGITRVLFQYRSAEGADVCYRAEVSAGDLVELPGCRSGPPVGQHLWTVVGIQRVVHSATASR